MPERFVRIASRAAISTGPIAALVWLLLIYIGHPTPTGGAPGNGGGIDAINWWILIFSSAVPLGLAAAWHISFGKLLKHGKNTCPGV
ncbi:MAG: hypothetical protein IT356_06655 [Gemmatimonadaceae bacterium]|nr:hypothetical protein [Gemmatimonadaceae bacterium]